jgi:outer membrane lipoprotein-sorting protein
MKKISFLIALILPLSILAQKQDVRKLMENMLKSVDEVKGIKYNFKYYERTKSGTRIGDNEVKVSEDPLKAYIYVNSPQKGAEVLYLSNESKDKVLVKPDGFPYMSVNIPFENPSFRQEQHHVITHVGLRYFGGIIRDAMKRADAQNKFDEIFILKGSLNWEGRDCWVMVIDYADFDLMDYTVLKGENLSTIADKLKVNDYMLLLYNPKIKDFKSVKEGQVIKVPDGYAKKTILYIDKEHNIPIMQSMFDKDGMFQKYEYRNVVVNPKYAPDEFTKGFKSYNF